MHFNAAILVLDIKFTTDSGASILLKNVKNRKIVSGLHTIPIRNIDNNIFPDFKTYLNSIKFVKKQIVAYVTRISVYGLSKNNLKKVRIPLPPVDEQQKIASILSTVDELILKNRPNNRTNSKTQERFDAEVTNKRNWS